jgi:hypothetical protein
VSTVKEDSNASAQSDMFCHQTARWGRTYYFLSPGSRLGG